jgi:CheY-like chemotaxis protein
MDSLSLPRLEVLVVDDDDDLRETMREVIEEHGFPVFAARSASAAVTRLAEHAPPGLILLDLAMPDMDGLTFAEGLRGDQAFAQIPVVIVSAVVQGLVQSEIGWATDVLTKPLALCDLLRVVRSHCEASPPRSAGQRG